MPPRSPAFLLLCLLPSLSLAADEDLRALVRALSSQVQQLTHRVNDLENQLAREKRANQQAAASPSAGSEVAGAKPPPQAAPSSVTPAAAKTETKPVTAGDIKGSIKIPGTETSLSVGGYAKLDAIYSSVSGGKDNIGDQLLNVSSIPVGAARHGENSQITLHAKETRFWFKSFTPSAYGDINTYLELDLFGAADSYTPRLRHAYGSMGPFLGGQTWTTFINVAAIPETLDIGSPVGIGIVRQPLIRWTQPFSFKGAPLEFQAALESPQTRLALESLPVIFAPDDNRYPDLMARLNFNPEWGTLSLVGMTRQIRNAPATGGAISAWGGAVSLAGRINTNVLDNLRFTLSYGNVLGRYIAVNTFGDAALDNSGTRLELDNTYSAMLSYQHWWSNRWRSTLAYGFAQTDLPAFANGGLTRQAQSVHLNLLWSPFLQTTLGLEYIYATRSLENGQYGDLHRVQFSSRFNF